MPPRHPMILLIRPYEQSIVFAAEFLAETGFDVDTITQVSQVLNFL